MRGSKEELEQRVVRAAEAALADRKYVSAIDLFTWMGLLAPAHVEAWRKGRLNCLEEVLQGGAEKISFCREAFRRWAESKGLQPTETSYVCRTRAGVQTLQFTRSGDPALERFYRTQFVSPELSEQKRAKLTERLEKPPQPVVFEIVRESQCSECGVELPEDSFLFMEAGQPLCLACARLDDLEYLPAGDTALTRRATKYSRRSAVVVRFSRSRGRYERQGILVEAAALKQAEGECTEDAEERAAARARTAERTREQDRELAAKMAERLLALFPCCPPQEAEAVARHTAVRGSGRVGRTAAGRALEEQALTAAVAAAVRHRHTNYDELLLRGMERARAREEVADQVQSILAKWRG